MKTENKTENLLTFFCLYIAQNLPMSFFSTVLPVIMRQEEFSLSLIGMLQFIKLPWIIKFFWSPVVDRYTVYLNDYKKCIIFSELIYALLILSLTFMNIKSDFMFIISILVISFVASATQDIATDALAIRAFSNSDKSLLNSMQSMGSFGGSLIGGGFLLLLFKEIGWNNIIPYMSVFVVLAIIPLIINKNIVVKPENNRPKADKKDILRFFMQKTIWKHLIFLFMYYAGLIGILAMLKPYLVDLGYDMKSIGVMSGILGTFIGFVSSFTGGYIVRKIGLDISRILFAVLICFTTSYFLMLSFIIPSKVLLYIGVMLLWGSYGFATIVVYTTAMNNVRQGREGTDFTLQTVITHLSGMCMAVFSGRIADMFGYKGLFAFEFSIAIISLLYVIYAYSNIKRIIFVR
ncbi:MAG: MFS transporter [Parabacteroides sp.]|nr:MFS transporter [Parabacteroides sp.]